MTWLTANASTVFSAFDVDGDRTLDYDELVYCISMCVYGVLTSFKRLVSISRGRGWFLFEFEAVRTASSDRVAMRSEPVH